MDRNENLKLNSLTEKQLSDRELSYLLGGEPGVPCSGGGCKGAGLEANVNNTMKNLRDVNPPRPEPSPEPPSEEPGKY